MKPPTRGSLNWTAISVCPLPAASSRHGFLPGLGGGLALARTEGPYKAKEMLFTADFFTAQDVAAAGLVNHVVLDDELVEFVDKLVAKLAERKRLGWQE